MWNFKLCDEIEAQLAQKTPLTGQGYNSHFVVYLYRETWWFSNLWLREETHIWGTYTNMEELKAYLKKLSKADEVRIKNFY